MRRGFKAQCSACGREFFTPITKEIRPYIRERGLRSLLWFRCPYCDKEFESYPIRFEARRRAVWRWWNRVTYGQPRLKFTYTAIPAVGGYVLMNIYTEWLPKDIRMWTGVVGVVGCIVILFLYMMSGRWWSKGTIVGTYNDDDIYFNPMYSNVPGNIYHKDKE
jgi:hypothetical protein